MRKAALCFIICLAAVLGGCGNEDFPGAAGMSFAMEDAPIVDYAVPESTPNILVNRRGYLSGGAKEAVVKGSRLPEEFRLVDAGTGEAVYEGWIAGVQYDAQAGIYVGYAPFHEYEREGSYYLECDYIGRSYAFALEDDFYRNLFLERYREMANDCVGNMATVADIMSLLRAYEWQGDAFGDDNGNSVPDVMELLCKWVERIDYGQISKSEGQVYAALLAKFSYLYQKYDLAFATECLQRASGIFSKTWDGGKDAGSFLALAELYRAAGKDTYGNLLLEYKASFQGQDNLLEESDYLYGAMTYMVTRQAVDVELCALFMEKLLDMGEEIGGDYRDMMRPANSGSGGAEELLRKVDALSCANYVLQNYQNDRILEDLLNYLMGGNLKSVDFYGEQGERHRYLPLLAHLALLKTE